MKILGIETSCDETAAAVIAVAENDKIKMLSNIIASSMHVHATTGGIIPEIAARNQSTYIIPVIQEALEKAGISFGKNTLPAIDAIAVTIGPGLIGSLLVGVETAKTLSLVWNKPLIPVNHLFGHMYANWIDTTKQTDVPAKFPIISLIVSGGHTDLVLIKKHQEIVWLGGTRDDAAGEAFDKTGRLLGFPYPAGPAIEKAAHLGNPKHFHFPRPLMHESPNDFSFSGLKTAALREVQNQKQMDQQTSNDIAWALQDAIIDVLIFKTLNAVNEFCAPTLILSGGVSANQTLRDAFQKEINKRSLPVTFFVPAKNLCTDNAAMIAAAGYFNHVTLPLDQVAANPELYFD